MPRSANNCRCMPLINYKRTSANKPIMNFEYCILPIFRKYKFVHSDHFYGASLSPLLLRSAPDTARILCRSFTPKRHRQLGLKGLAQGLYMAARAGVEPTTLRLKAIDSTNAPPCP